MDASWLKRAAAPQAAWPSAAREIQSTIDALSAIKSKLEFVRNSEVNPTLREHVRAIIADIEQLQRRISMVAPPAPPLQIVVTPEPAAQFTMVDE